MMTIQEIMMMAEALKAEVREDIKKEEEMYGSSDSSSSSVTVQFLKDPCQEMFPGFVKRPVAVCNDGFSVSIQASVYHYCSPKEVLADGNYEDVELGFPSEEDDLISEYAEDPCAPTQTVYPYVPVDVVDRLIEKHGGLAESH